MTQLIWGSLGTSYYETGLDHGVLYVGTGVGVPWNGLISVSESPSGGEAKPFYIDGIRYSNRAAAEEFAATITAYTYPDEFGECDGSAPIKNGLFATQQRRKSFGLSYRTRIGNDVDGVEHGYKLHLLYGASVAPSARDNQTMGETVEPFNFSWQVTAKPQLVAGFKPTPHFVIDSRETPLEVLNAIEEILYGTDTTQARLPSIPELRYIFESFNASIFDAGTPIEPYFATFDAGASPDVVNLSTVDGGLP